MNQRDEVVDSIHELNLAWLRLARLIAQGDVRHASETLGVAPPVVGLLARSTDSRLAELAAIPQLLCAFRFESKVVLASLGSDAATDTDQVTATAVTTVPS
jgi:Flagellar transcriptional activator (FlhD)